MRVLRGGFAPAGAAPCSKQNQSAKKRETPAAHTAGGHISLAGSCRLLWIQPLLQLADAGKIAREQEQIRQYPRNRVRKARCIVPQRRDKQHRHHRAADRNAHADVYALLKKYQPKGIVHCYSGSADDAVWLAKQGLFIGFGGACTFKGAKRAAKAISALPLESIVLETDCPYMAPEPVRGTRCDSSLIRYVGEYIAQLRGISAEEVFRTTAENARRVYGL